MKEISSNLKLFSITRITYGYSTNGQVMGKKYFLAKNKSEVETYCKKLYGNLDQYYYDEESTKFVIEEHSYEILN